MKKQLIFAGAIIASTLAAQAQSVVYSTDASTEYTASGSGAFVLGGATPDVVATNWFGSSNGVTVSGGVIGLNNTTQNRYRGAGVWLDTSVAGWDAGTVTVQFDVANFTAGTDSEVIFQVFGASGVDASNSVSLDLHGSQGLDGSPVATGSATIAMIGSEQTIAGSTTSTPSTESVSFTYNGTDQYIALVFANSNASGTGTGNTVDISNITVTVPEPGTYALLAGLSGLAFVMLRRRA